MVSFFLRLKTTWIWILISVLDATGGVSQLIFLQNGFQELGMRLDVGSALQALSHRHADQALCLAPHDLQPLPEAIPKHCTGDRP